MALRRWLLPVLISLPLLQAVNVALLDGAFAGKFLSNLFQALAATLAAWLTIRAARSLRQANDPAAKGWAFIAAAMVFDALGMISFMFIEVVLLKPDPYPGLPDVFFLLLYPLMIYGLRQLPREAQSRSERWNNFLDVGALAVLASLFIWQFNLRLLLPTLSTEPNAGTWVSLGYTFVDTLLLLMIFSVLVRKLGQGRQFVPMLLLVIGCFFLITADLLQGYVTTSGEFTSGSPIDLGWVLFSTFCGLAALQRLGPARPTDSQTGSTPRLEMLRTGWTLAITYFWIAMVVVLLVWALFHREEFHVGALMGGVAAALFLAITRQFRTLRENTRLNAELQRAAAQLEIKVQQRTAELERQQALLAESEQRTRAIFDLSFGFIGLLDLKGTVLDANQSALQFAGVERDAVVGRPFWDTPWWRHSPEMRDRVRAAVRTAASGEVVRFEATHAAADGEVRTVDFSIKPVFGEGGKVVLLIPEGRDITERKQAEEVLRGSEARAQRQRAAIAKLVLDEAVATARPPDAIQRITETLAETLQVERASVWRLAEDLPELRCLSLFEAGRKIHSREAALKTTDFPRYFEVIRAESRIAAHDAQTDPRTSELAAGYLVPLGITSMLDAGIQMEGKLAGVVCLEHTGLARRWHPDEEAFVSTAAALVAQLFASAERHRAEAALRQSEDRYRKIAQCSPDVVWMADMSGQYTFASPAVERVYGWTPEEMLKLTLRDTATPEQAAKDAAMLAEGLARVASGRYDRNRVRTFESEERRKDGSIFWAEVSASFLWSDDGQPTGIIGITRDISERRRAAEALRANEERLRAIVEGTPYLFFYTQDTEARITYVSPTVERITGYAPEAWMQTRDWFVTESPVNQVARQRTRAHLRGEVIDEPFQVEARHADGHPILLEVYENPIFRDGQVVGLQGVAHDITERERTQKLLNRRAAFDALIARILTGFASCTSEEVDDRIRACLEELTRFVGVDSGVLALFSPGQTTWSIAYCWAAPGYPDVTSHHQQVPITPANWAAMKLLAGEPVVINRIVDIPPEATIERQFFERDGLKARVALPLFGRKGRVIGAIGFRSYAREVTWMVEDFHQLRVIGEAVVHVLERKTAEAALNESERRFRDLFERSPDAVFVEDACGVILDANPAACRLHGVSRDQLVGKNVLETVPPEFRERVAQAFPKWMTGELTQAEGVSLTADGRQVPVEIRGELIRYSEQPALLLHVRDISERKQAEARIRQQAALLEASHDAILVWDVTAGVQYMNPAAEDLTGMKFAEAQSQELGAVLRTRSDLELRAAIQEVTARGDWAGELELLAGENRSRTVASRWTVLTDTQGKPASVLITCNDVTERKQLEAQYLRAQRLESVGTLASGVAHDLNNILSPIIMGVEMLHNADADPDTQSILSMMKESARRGADTVKQLLTFARGAESRRGPVQPRHLLKEIARLLQQTFPKNIQIYTDYAEQPATVLADPSQLHQVLMNLCVNARDAMPEGGVLFLTLENKTLDETGAKIHPKARPIPYVVFKVSDSGTGIPPEILDRIFDPFFTTKPQGKGTGLGLATVLGIAESHGGFVLVESKPGQGTTFQVFLPASAVANGTEPAAGPLLAARGRGELVLVVDDEPAVLRMAEGVLRRGGYETLAATSASQALSLFEKHHDQIRVVLTDIMMPFGDGRQLIAMLYDQDAKLPIIAMSGHATGDFQRETLKRGARTFFSKPFTAEQLLAAIADALKPAAV